MIIQDFSPAKLFILLALCGGCARIHDKSEIRGFNAIEDSTGFPATLAIEVRKTDDATSAYCAASFIRSDLLLTAAHCLIDARAVLVHGSFLPFNGTRPEEMISSQRFTIHPEYKGVEDDLAKTGHDLAIVTFYKGTAPLEQVVRLPTQAISAGMPVYLLGYPEGFAAGEEKAARKVERREISGVDPSQTILLHPARAGEKPSQLLNSGASASLLYNLRFELIGIQGERPETVGVSDTPFSNLSDPRTRSFLDEALKTEAILAPAVTTAAKAASSGERVGYQCIDSIARLTLFAGSKPQILSVPGTCRPKLSCEGATLLVDGPLIDGSSLLGSAALCESAKSGLEDAMKAAP